MNVMLGIFLCCLLSNAAKASVRQQTKLESLKSLIINNAKATVTLDSSDLKQLLKLSKSTSVGATSPKPGVGFSVNVKATHLTLGKGQTVVYDGIMTNEGNGYDDRTGVFTCPVAGTYMFVVDALCRQATWLALKLNTTTVALLHRDGLYSKNTLVQISRTVLLKLTKGDHVKVVSEGDKVFMNGYGYSGFTGTFLY
ncbi:complement C1q-like protein 2 isoform X2 [Crassostrea virginica]